MNRRVVSGLLVGLLSLAGVMLPASAAQATVPHTNCVGTETATYSPGVTVDPQYVVSEVHGEYTLCTSTDPLITSAEVDIHAEGTLSCLSGTVSGQQVITWNTGETSHVTFTLAVSQRPGGQVVVVASGTITVGKFFGHDVVQTAVVPALTALNCLTPEGITEASGATTATITAP